MYIYWLRFVCQQRMLKMFPGPGYLRSGGGLVWLWHLLIKFVYNIYVYMYI